MKRYLLLSVLPALLVIVIGVPLQAQVVREEGVKTIAGIVGEVGDAYDDYIFLSTGNEILAVSVDSQLYDKRGGEDHAEGGCEDGGETGGCEDSEGTGCDDADAGPRGLCLQLLDASGNVIQAVGRPRLPGWQRDPRLIAIIPATPTQETYTIRIALADEACGDLVYPSTAVAAPRPYLLNVSLRRLAPEGAGSAAVAASKNRF